MPLQHPCNTLSGIPRPKQAPLDFNPRIPVQDPGAWHEDRARLKGHNLTVWFRLQAGPATNAELAALLGPAAAWRTRVSDVRKWLERRGRTVQATRLEGGLWRYEVVERHA